MQQPTAAYAFSCAAWCYLHGIISMHLLTKGPAYPAAGARPATSVRSLLVAQSLHAHAAAALPCQTRQPHPPTFLLPRVSGAGPLHMRAAPSALTESARANPL